MYGSPAWRRWKHDHHWATTARAGPLVSDTFTRANGAIGTAETGQVWTDNGAGFQVISNTAGATAVGATLGTQCATLDAGVADCTITVKFATWGTATFIAFRFADTSNLLAFYLSGTNTARILKIEAGTQTTFFTGTTNTNIASGDTYTVVLSGTSITLKQNGTALATRPNAQSFNQTATKHGIGANQTLSRLDNFTITVP